MLMIQAEHKTIINSAYNKKAAVPKRIAAILLSIEEIAQLVTAGRVTKLSECLRLNLTDTLTRNAKVLSNLFQCTGSAVINTEPETQHALFTRRQCVKNILKLFLQKRE